MSTPSCTVSFAEVSENVNGFWYRWSVIKRVVELSSLTWDQVQDVCPDAPSAEPVDHPSRQIVPQGVNPASEGAEQRPWGVRGTADTSQEAGKPGSGSPDPQVLALSCPPLLSSPPHWNISYFRVGMVCGLSGARAPQDVPVSLCLWCPDEPRSKSPTACRRISGEGGSPWQWWQGIPGKVPAFVTDDRREGHWGVRPWSLPSGWSTPRPWSLWTPAWWGGWSSVSHSSSLTTATGNPRVMGMSDESLSSTPVSTHHCPDPACDLTSPGSGLCSHLCY